jgi:hypothetical protein
MSPSFREYVFQELGPAQIAIKNVNNSESSATFGISVTPEFPMYAILVPLLGFVFVVVALRYGRIKSGVAGY